MNTERLRALMKSLTNQTVLGELLAPASNALARVRDTDAMSRVLSMADFIGLGVLRHLQGMRTLREQVQSLRHRAPGEALRAPLARSTWSDALASRRRRIVLEAVLAPLLAEARAVLPDRLAGFPELAGREVYATDGTYQRESARYGRRTPRQGGEDDPKGHALLSFYNVRLGTPADVIVDTRPFNPVTTIPLQISTAGHVVLKVFDVLGREVETLLNQQMNAGRFSVQWNGRNSRGVESGSGVYFYRLETSQETITKRMLLLR